MALIKTPQLAVCPQCKREYPVDKKVCPVDGSPLQLLTRDNQATPVETPARGIAEVPTLESKLPPTILPAGEDKPLKPRKTGSLVAGEMVDEYQVTAKIGEGGMGTVYAGIQPLIGKKVAIKLLLPHVASNPEVVNRFVQEARAVNQIHSRYIVDIFSFGELERGLSYFVMEYIDGRPLRKFLQERGRLPFEEAYKILRAVIKGLSAAHAVGIVHRDLKPENIIVIEEDDGLTAKILDFGIAKLTGSASNPGFATATGMTLGTPYYMSPEQARGVGVDCRTDIYALGVIMFEMFTGSLPFESHSYIDLVNKHLFEPVPDASRLAEDVPQQLSSLIACCMSKDPGERPQQIEQVLNELKQLAPSLTGLSFTTSATLVRATGQQPDAHSQKALRPPVQQPVEPPPRRSGGRALYVVVGVLVAALVGGGLYAMMKSPPSAPPQRDAKTPPATVAVTVDSEPPGAEIRIDGKQQRGRTPMVVRVPPGEHRFTARLDKYKSRTVASTLERDGNVMIRLTPSASEVQPDASRPKQVAPDPGRLVVRSHPRAVYKIDGEVVGRGAKLDHSLPPGPHVLEISARGRKTSQREITIKAGKPTRLGLIRLKKQSRRRPGAKKPRPKGKIDSDGTLNPFPNR